MADLITIDQARQHLRLDSDSDGGADDAWLTTWIAVCSEAVSLWLKGSGRLYEPALDSDGQPILDSSQEPVPRLDSNLEPVVRKVVQAAVLIELAAQYRYREGEGVDNVVDASAGHGYVLNKASTALLVPLRKTTIR